MNDPSILITDPLTRDEVISVLAAIGAVLRIAPEGDPGREPLIGAYNKLMSAVQGLGHMPRQAGDK